MNEATTIDGKCREREPEGALVWHCCDRWSALLRKALVGTRLLGRVVRTLFRQAAPIPRQQTVPFNFFLLTSVRALMLAGIRCAGAGGGGPGQ